jgi:hypothetical protein
VLWNQSFGSAGEGWDGRTGMGLRPPSICVPQASAPDPARVLREDPAHVPGTNSGFRTGFTSCRRIGLSKDSSTSSGVVARAAPGFVASSASEQLTVLRARPRWRGRCAPGRLRQPGRGA